MPMALTRAMTAQMVVMLELLSDANVTHADLKPENIALFDRGLSDVTLSPDIQRQISLEEQERDGTNWMMMVMIGSTTALFSRFNQQFVFIAYERDTWHGSF
ncbi:hypothetical protein TcBrA4_0135110 [Trypanosoma cruzi]|nr:hypothetical protein TcBrA4_0135110 [Trypanosoma cruzi]